MQRILLLLSFFWYIILILLYFCRMKFLIIKRLFIIMVVISLWAFLACSLFCEYFGMTAFLIFNFYLRSFL